MKKRLFSLLLALCMVIGLLPVMALAEDQKPVGITEYLTLQDAIDAASAGQTVKLDIQPKDGWTVDKVTVNGEPLEPTVPVTQLGYQFVMPDEDAEVVVEFFNSDSTGTEE